MLKNTLDDHEDIEDLGLALSKIEEMVAYVNDRKRLAENLQKILDVQNQIDSTEELNLVSPSRRFVREGHFTVYEKGKPRGRTIYLFNDLLVITKPKRNASAKDHFKYQLSLNEAKIIDVAGTEEIEHACEIRPKAVLDAKQAYVIVFASGADKQQWLREIKALVKEFQRKQYLEDRRLAEESVNAPTQPETVVPESPTSSRRSSAARQGSRSSIIRMISREDVSTPPNSGNAPASPSRGGARKQISSIVGGSPLSWRKQKKPEGDGPPASPGMLKKTSSGSIASVEETKKKELDKSTAKVIAKGLSTSALGSPQLPKKEAKKDKKPPGPGTIPSSGLPKNNELAAQLAATLKSRQQTE